MTYTMSRPSNASTAVSPAASYRRFEIDRKVFSSHYKAKALIDGRKFHAENTSLKTGVFEKPEIALQDAANKRVLAACQFGQWSSSMAVCLGDPKDKSVNWEPIRKENTFKAIDYSWDTRHASDTEMSLKWKRTKVETVDGLKNNGDRFRNLKLIDRRTGEVFAVYQYGRGWHGVGTLEIRPDFGEDFDMMVLVTCMAMFEKMWRRSPMNAAHDGTPSVGIAAGSGGC